MQFVGPARPTVTGTLRTLEEVLLRRGRRTALRNAWAAVQEDRARAAERSDAQRTLKALKALKEGAVPVARPSSRPDPRR